MCAYIYLCVCARAFIYCSDEPGFAKEREEAAAAAAAASSSSFGAVPREGET